PVPGVAASLVGRLVDAVHLDAGEARDLQVAGHQVRVGAELLGDAASFRPVDAVVGVEEFLAWWELDAPLPVKEGGPGRRGVTLGGRCPRLPGVGDPARRGDPPARRAR